jgi:chromosome partitioning protein
MRVLAFASRKSGAGKTTLAAHVAIQAQRSGRSVALIDSDPSASLAAWCALPKLDTPTVVQAELGAVGQELARLGQEGTDLVVVDTPPAIHLGIEKVLVAADLVAIPARPCVHDVEAAGVTAELVARHGKPFVFVVNGMAPDGELTPDIVMGLAQHGTVSTVTIPRSIAFVDSMIDGRTVMELTEDESPAMDIAKLWEYLGDRMAKFGTAAMGNSPPDSEPQGASEADGNGAFGPEQLRRYPRWTYEQPATLLVGQRQIACVVQDISAGGAQIRASEPLDLGDKVVLSLDAIGPLDAEVRQCDENRVGIRFTIDARRQWDLVKQLAALIGSSPVNRHPGDT